MRFQENASNRIEFNSSRRIQLKSKIEKFQYHSQNGHLFAMYQEFTYQVYETKIPTRILVRIIQSHEISGNKWNLKKIREYSFRAIEHLDALLLTKKINHTF